MEPDQENLVGMYISKVVCRQLERHARDETRTCIFHARLWIATAPNIHYYTLLQSLVS